MTRDELLAEADALEAEAQRIERAVAILERHGRPVDVFRARVQEMLAAAREVRGIAEGLQDVPSSRTVVRMEPESKPLKISAARATEHPFTEALRKRHMTIGEWAVAHGLSREKVSSWLRASGGRRIPAEWAERIRAEFGVPLDAWPHGVKQ